MDLTITRHIDALSVIRVARQADALASKSPLVAEIMHAAAALADGEPAEAGRRIVGAICSIDGKPVDPEVIAEARAALAPLRAAVEAGHTCQTCSIRSLVDMIDRFERSITPYRTGELLGSVSAYVGEMTRARHALSIAA